MNGLTTHEEYAKAHLADRTAWQALVDHHEELLDVPHRVAVRAVAVMRRQQRRRVELERAAELLRAESPGSSSLRSAIVNHFSHPEAQDATIFVKEGRARPRWRWSDQIASEEFPADGTIVVGARYVLKLHKLRLLMRELECSEFWLALDALMHQ